MFDYGRKGNQQHYHQVCNSAESEFRLGKQWRVGASEKMRHREQPRFQGLSSSRRSRERGKRDPGNEVA